MRYGSEHTLGGRLGDLWDARYLIYQLIRRDVKVRYKQAVIGLGWAVFLPAVIVLSGLMVRSIAAHLSGAPTDLGALGGLMVKSLPWMFFTSSLGTATPSIAANHHLVSKVFFPREVLPLATTAASAFDVVIGSVVVLILLPFLGVMPTWSWFWVPVLATLLVLFTLACGLLFSCANVFFRDVKYIVQVVVTFGIFFTPIFYEPAMAGKLGKWLMLNPVAPLVEGLRIAIVEGHGLTRPLFATADPTVLVWHPAWLVYSAVWAIGGLLVSAAVFRRGEVMMAEYV